MEGEIISKHYLNVPLFSSTFCLFLITYPCINILLIDEPVPSTSEEGCISTAQDEDDNQEKQNRESSGSAAALKQLYEDLALSSDSEDEVSEKNILNFMNLSMSNDTSI